MDELQKRLADEYPDGAPAEVVFKAIDDAGFMFWPKERTRIIQPGHPDPIPSWEEPDTFTAGDDALTKFFIAADATLWEYDYMREHDIEGLSAEKMLSLLRHDLSFVSRY